MKTYDLIIIGSGSMGAAGGYYASRSGLRTLLIDAHTPPHDQGAHHGQTRLYRYLYHNDAYQHLLNRAAILWPQLEGAHHARLLTRCGVINLAPKTSASLAAKRLIAERYRLPYQWLEADAIEKRWPGLSVPADTIGLYETEAGYLHSESAVALLLEQAQRNGADTAFNQPVTRIAREAEILRVESGTQHYHAHRVALCAGTWANHIAGLGFQLPFTPVRKTFAWYDVPAAYQESHGFPGFTAETADGIYYGFPDSGDGLKVGATTVAKSCGQQPSAILTATMTTGATQTASCNNTSRKRARCVTAKCAATTAPRRKTSLSACTPKTRASSF